MGYMANYTLWMRPELGGDGSVAWRSRRRCRSLDGAMARGKSLEVVAQRSSKRWWRDSGFRQPDGVGFVKIAPPGLKIFVARAQSLYWSILVQADVFGPRLY